MDGQDTFKHRFWRAVCAYKPVWFAILGIEAMLMGLIVFSLVFGSPDEHTRAILVLNFLLVGSTFLACLYVLVRCRRREQEKWMELGQSGPGEG